MRILLVGGAVRNILLGLPIRDRDYLVADTTVEAFLAAFPRAKPVGKTFPVFILEGLEFSLLRGQSIGQDFAARDFTVNAIALDEQGELLCHEHALEDITTHVLRPASAQSLRDDPLRVFRAARFLSVLPGFTAHEGLFEAMGLSLIHI